MAGNDNIIEIPVGEEPLIVKVGKEDYLFLPPSQVDGRRIMEQFRGRVKATQEIDWPSATDEDDDEAPMSEADIDRMEAGMEADLEFLSKLCINKEEAERFRKASLPLGAAGVILNALMEKYTGRPTDRSPSSSGRPSAPRKGGRR
jgi:hypothetical protein